MTTALTVTLPARPTMRAVSTPCAPPLAAVRIGFGEDLLAVLRAALGATETPVQVVTGEPAGYVVAAEAWSGQRPPADVAETLCGLGHFDGRPVGLVVHAGDIADAVSSLAVLRVFVIAAGGLPLGGGICVETVDLATDASGDLVDITLHSRLALLGHRVQRMAANRLALRATA